LEYVLSGAATNEQGRQKGINLFFLAADEEGLTIKQ
jgi:hypothetical protein